MPVKRRRRKKPSPRRARSGAAGGAATRWSTRRWPSSRARVRRASACGKWPGARGCRRPRPAHPRGSRDAAGRGGGARFRGRWPVWSRQTQPEERFRARHRLRALRPGAPVVPARGRSAPRRGQHPALKAAGERTFTLLVQAIAECQAAAARAGCTRCRGGRLVHRPRAGCVAASDKSHATTRAEAERLTHTITDCFMSASRPARDREVLRAAPVVLLPLASAPAAHSGSNVLPSGSASASQVGRAPPARARWMACQTPSSRPAYRAGARRGAPARPSPR